MLPLVPRVSVLSDPSQAAARLEREGIDPWVARALAARGVESPDEALMRFRLLPYQGLKGIGPMAEALAEAIGRGDRMTVVADYDCDGATACTVAVSGLRALGAVIDFVVPNRFVHGYGLTPGVVDLVRERFPQTRIIITVDNGIASVAGVDAANGHGLSVMVTDHHLPGDRLPAAAGIVNPNQPGCAFASKNLAGCGVMYYVLAAVRDAMRRRGALPGPGPNLAEWLDVVALGTVADVVRLDANNRWLVRQGLARIRQGFMRPGIRALFDVSNRNPDNACSSDFGFSLGPRLNAAGRLKDMTVGIRCLLAEDDAVALSYAKQLHALNEERKSIELTMHEAADALLDLEGQQGNFTRTAFRSDFHEGVIGIVAGRIKEAENVPTMVFAPAQENGFIKGSGRSIAGLHLRDALDLVHKRGHDLFLKFGGHAMAAGVTLEQSRLKTFTELFESVVRELMGNRRRRKEIVIDGSLPTEAINEDTATALANEVWGQGFEEPVWEGRFRLVEAKLVGKAEQKHLKMVVERDGRCWDAMHFRCDQLPMPESGWIRLAYRVGVNDFRGERSVTLVVVDKDDAAMADADMLARELPASSELPSRGVARL